MAQRRLRSGDVRREQHGAQRHPPEEAAPARRGHPKAALSTCSVVPAGQSNMSNSPERAFCTMSARPAPAAEMMATLAAFITCARARRLGASTPQHSRCERPRPRRQRPPRAAGRGLPGPCRGLLPPASTAVALPALSTRPATSIEMARKSPSARSSLPASTMAPEPVALISSLSGKRQPQCASGPAPQARAAARSQASAAARGNDARARRRDCPGDAPPKAP